MYIYEVRGQSVKTHLLLITNVLIILFTIMQLLIYFCFFLSCLYKALFPTLRYKVKVTALQISTLLSFTLNISKQKKRHQQNQISFHLILLLYFF